MSKRKLSKLLSIIMLAIILMTISVMTVSCGDKEKISETETNSASQSDQTEKVCYITIEDYCDDQKITMHDGDSVYDILNQTDARISARKTSTGIYVEGINGKFEFDEGPTSGWVYYVNDVEITKSCSKHKVNDGDKIVWEYVTEY